MKKIIIAIAFSLLAAGAAFATGAPTGTLSLSTTGLSAYGGKTTTTDTLIGKTSTGVGFGWSTGATGYAVWTQHKSGSRAFGGSYDSTAIFYSDATPGTAVTPANASASDATAFSGWTSM